MTVRSFWFYIACGVALGGSSWGCEKAPDPKPQPKTVEKLKSEDETQRDAGIDDVQKEYEKKK